MAVIIQLRRDTSTNWSTVNPILAEGEQGLELNTGKLKLGNGIDPWNLLPYYNGGVSNLNYRHIQSVASSLWTVNHNLGYKPGGIMSFDSAGTQWFGTVIHIDDNNLTINFNGAVFSGEAYIS